MIYNAYYTDLLCYYKTLTSSCIVLIGASGDDDSVDIAALSDGYRLMIIYAYMHH